MTATDITTAVRRLATGDQTPCRPWAYLSNVGEISDVSEVASVSIGDSIDGAGFDMTVGGTRYRLIISRLAGESAGIA